MVVNNESFSPNKGNFVVQSRSGSDVGGYQGSGIRRSGGFQIPDNWSSSDVPVYNQSNVVRLNQSNQSRGKNKFIGGKPCFDGKPTYFNGKKPTVDGNEFHSSKIGVNQPDPRLYRDLPNISSVFRDYRVNAYSGGGSTSSSNTIPAGWAKVQQNSQSGPSIPSSSGGATVRQSDATVSSKNPMTNGNQPSISHKTNNTYPSKSSVYHQNNDPPSRSSKQVDGSQNLLGGSGSSGSSSKRGYASGSSKDSSRRYSNSSGGSGKRTNYHQMNVKNTMNYYENPSKDSAVSPENIIYERDVIEEEKRLSVELEKRRSSMIVEKRNSAQNYQIMDSIPLEAVDDNKDNSNPTRRSSSNSNNGERRSGSLRRVPENPTLEQLVHVLSDRCPWTKEVEAYELLKFLESECIEVRDELATLNSIDVDEGYFNNNTFINKRGNKVVECGEIIGHGKPSPIIEEVEEDVVESTSTSSREEVVIDLRGLSLKESDGISPIIPVDTSLTALVNLEKEFGDLFFNVLMLGKALERQFGKESFDMQRAKQRAVKKISNRCSYIWGSDIATTREEAERIFIKRKAEEKQL